MTTTDVYQASHIKRLGSTKTEVIARREALFDYDSVPAAAAAMLQQQAMRLRSLITKTTADMIEIGGELIRIKADLDHGQFTSWVEAEIRISVRTAQGYMRFAMLADGKSATVSLLPPSTARMLAAKSAPTEIVNHVISQAASGNILPDRVVKDMIGEANFDRKQQQTAERLAAKKARRPKAIRDREAAQRLEYEAERAREQAAQTARAQSIIDRLAPADLHFVMEMLNWDVLDELLRLYRERAA